MSVGLWRRACALGAALAVAASLAACSTSSRAAGPGGAGTGSVAPSASGDGGGSSAVSHAAATQRTPGAPITVVAPSGVADPQTSAATDTTAESSSDPAGPTTSTAKDKAGPTASSSHAKPGKHHRKRHTAAPTTPTKPATPAATVTGSPKLGSTGLAPAAGISISVHGGTIRSLTFTNPDGKKVKGTLSKNRTRWTLGEPLGFDRKYTVRGVAVNADGAKTKIKGSYVTAGTVEPVTTSISPGNGAVVGVAAPVIVRFGMDPQNKALIEKHVKITTTPKVKGAWAWITHDGDTYPSLDWRPEKYWPSGTKVHVESDIYGVKFADGWYGGNSRSVDFTIGRNQVVIANAKTHTMTVKRDGKTVATYPASLGMGDDPNSEYGLRPSLVTRSGIHIVMDKTPKILMSNPGYYKDVPEYWAVRISDNGEFIHYNEGTTSYQLGHINKTHGCINLSEADAKAYYETAIYGDPVDVIGTSVKLSPSDGDIYDWAIPWSTWKTLSALAKNSIID